MSRFSIGLTAVWLLIPQLVVAFSALQSTEIDSIFTYDFDQRVFNSYPVTMDVTTYGGIIGESSYGTLNTSILDDFDDFLNPDTTILHRVLDHFSAMDYPFSSAVKLQMLRSDTLVSRCSGLVISDYWIATASHCSNIRETHFNKWPSDSVTSFFASPAFHNGTPHPTIGPVKVDKAIFFSGRSSGARPDIIFFRLTEPVGKLTGTVKMSASAMQNIPSDSRLLTFGYPGRHIWAERYPNKYGSMYNADTLFFSQNKLREVDPRYIFAHGHANPGQSGSPVLLYQNGQWVSYGVISFATTG
ncbi:MAG: serine protease, partial [Balneolales bacterium]|nr:serine protease [Balneolales bacterium]